MTSFDNGGAESSVSNILYFQTQPPIGAPTIIGISPNPAPASNSQQLMTVTGAGFQQGATITWKDLTNQQIYADRHPVTTIGSQISIQATFGDQSADWSVQVVNPDFQKSNEFNFRVQADNSENLQVSLTDTSTPHPISIIGACTDGSTQIVIRVTGFSANIQREQVTFVPPNEAWAVVNSVQFNGVEHWAEQTFRVPADYPGNGVGFVKQWFTVHVGTSEPVTKSIDLARCPVLLVPGLGGASSTWTDMDSALLSDFLFRRSVDYKGSGSLSFWTNRDIVPNAILNTLNETRAAKFAVSKVDVVAHSMGGILTRYYIEDLSSTHYSEREDIRRFITIGTPHSGTEVANLVVGTRDNFSPLIWGALLLLVGIDIDREAIDNLAVDSDAIKNLNESTHINLNAVPSHSIVGVTSSDCTSLWGFIHGSFQCQDGDAASVLGLPNDSIVGGLSQAGGLAGTYSDSIPPFCHTGETKNPDVISKVITLLKTSESSRHLYFADMGFNNPQALFPVSQSLTDLIECVNQHATSSATTQQAVPSSAVNTALGITIVTPSGGAIVEPGSQVDITVEAQGDINSVFFLAGVAFEVVTQAPFSYSFMVPDDYLGPLTIFAAGTDGQGHLVEDQREIDVVTTAAVQGVTIQSPKYLSLLSGQDYHLSVTGHFADGISRDVTAAMFGTTYSVGDDAVAVVDENGVITAVAPGKSVLVAENGTASDEITVDVLENNVIEPTIKVLEPRSGDTWAPGTKRTVTWNSKGDVGPYVKIELWRKNQYVATIKKRTPNDGEQICTLPSSVPTGKNYKVLVYSIDKPAVKDFSKGSMTVR